MKHSTNTDPYYPGQPLKAFVALDSHPVGVGCVTRGMQGYVMVYDYSHSIEGLGHARVVACAEEVADKMNAAIGVTKGQAIATKIGSMAGWHVPGANPALWTEDGEPVRERQTVKA